MVYGTLWPTQDGWANMARYAGPAGESWSYQKVNLAAHERARLTAGDVLPVFEVPGLDAALGVQLCRDLRFPEQWQALCRRGAQVLCFLTNATNPRDRYDVWRTHLISRAAENQRWVISANVASPQQCSPSMIVAPSGEVVSECPNGASTVITASIDPSAISDWYLSQARADVVEVSYKR
ncbi:MAG: carbon-nitrogen hydrolase family protein [Mycobacteriales bacterium]